MKRIEIRDSIGAGVHAARQARGLSLRQLAERLDSFGLHLDHNALSRLERGDRGLDVAELLVIAAALDTSPDVIVFPDDDQALVGVSDTLVERSGRLRDWWGGRTPLLGTWRRAPRPSWPVRDEVTSHDAIRDRSDYWRSRRPTRERRAYARDGVERLADAVGRFVTAAGRRAEPSGGDRVKMLEALRDAVSGFRTICEADDIRRGEDAAHLDAARDMHAALLAITAAYEHDNGRTER